MAILLKAKKLVFLQQALGTKVSRTLAAVASGGSSLHSGFTLITVLERKENYYVIYGIADAGLAGLCCGLDVDNLGLGVVVVH